MRFIHLSESTSDYLLFVISRLDRAIHLPDFFRIKDWVGMIFSRYQPHACTSSQQILRSVSILIFSYRVILMMHDPVLSMEKGVSSQFYEIPRPVFIVGATGRPPLQH